MNAVTPSQAAGPRGPATSLRSRWHRAFVVLFLVVVTGGVANFALTRTLVGTSQATAHMVERQATVLAHLRAELVPHAILVTRSEGFAPVPALEASIRAGFEQGIARADLPAVRRPLEQSRDRWEAMVAAVGPLDHPASLEARGAAIATGIPEVLSLLDRAGDASRADARADLVRDNRREGIGTVVLALLVVLVSLLMLRFARRLSAEVLRPVGLLRDSANQLAAGELDHRVEFSRGDELGELARSFNAMADAIAGSQRSLSRQAHHDALTGLANRAAFQARLEAALARPERRGGTEAVLFVDLDDFKDVNDTLGHAAGDELLSAVASRLSDVVRPGDLVARLGGDEFALLLDGVPDVTVAVAVAERAVAALATPVEIFGDWVHVGASIGLAMRHAMSDPDSLMREADVAMYSAKGRGKNRVERYDAALHDAVVEHHALKTELAGAAARGELVVDYQPIVDLISGKVAGVEGLVRWQHPTRGLLPPSAFIDVAEETGAILEIGSWVLETAAAQLCLWQRRYQRPDLRLSVNVSVCQLEDPGFADRVTDLLRHTGLAPTSLILEVTESVLAGPAGGTAASLEALRCLGVAVALDDFGTGYSSISYLRQLPVDIIKIDRSFVSGENADRPGDLLLEAIVGLAQRLGLDVIPEGIEEPHQLSRLRSLGCRTGQGFLLSRPAAPATIERLLAPLTCLVPVQLEDAPVAAV